MQQSFMEFTVLPHSVGPTIKVQVSSSEKEARKGKGGNPNGPQHIPSYDRYPQRKRA